LAGRYLKADSSILDYGAGDNLYLVRELVNRGYSAAAFEPNVAVRKHDAALVRSEHFEGMIAKVQAASFDCIFLSEVIEHLGDAALSKTLHSVARGLKVGGTLVVTTPDNENLLEASRYCPTCHQLFHPWGHIRSFSAPSLEETLARFGFECMELRSVDFSSNREQAMKLAATQAEIRSVAVHLRHVADGLETTALETCATLVDAVREASSNLWELAGMEPTGDPTRWNIGNGGTLFAVARMR